jgi:serralysin
MSHSIPSTSDSVASTLENTAYVLKTRDFNFSDADGDPLQSVAITTLPHAGSLQLKGRNVFAGTTITAADIDAGYLVLTPGADADGAAYPAFGFKVCDGAAWSGQAFFNLSAAAPTRDLGRPGGPMNADFLPNTATAGNDTYAGTSGDDAFDGLAGDDTMSGYGGSDNLSGGPGNDYLDGGAGVDWMVGGDGKDIYVVDNADDWIFETDATTAGIDEVRSSISYALGDNLERLTLTGGDPIYGCGNALSNLIKGNAGDNTLNGIGGGDTLQGGAGNDTYVVNGATDVVTELSGQGSDTIETALAVYALPANVENLTYNDTTSWTAFTGTGNALNNVITGGSAADTLSGGAGDDTFIGAGGSDTIEGGLGSDTVVLPGERANYAIARPSAATVVISLRYYGDIVMTLTGVEHVQFADYTGDLTLADLLANIGSAGDDVFVGGDNQDLFDGLAGNDTMNGNGGDDGLYGGLGNDYLDGGAGDDWMVGDAGNDIYVVDSVWDRVDETGSAASEVDEVRSGIDYMLGDNIERLTLTGAAPLSGMGNELANLIKGNAGANTLDGGAGGDTMQGGAGDDTYMVDAASDVVRELSGEGSDMIVSSVTYTLPANVESLQLTNATWSYWTDENNLNASGNALNNTLIGNDGDNVLDGVAGVNTLIGGKGDDTYVIHNLAELANAVELEGEGADALKIGFGNASTTNPVLVDMSTANLANIEDLTLAGKGWFNVIGNDGANVLTGNAAANALTGGSGDDVLNGLAGADILAGGTGNDSYYVDNARDQVIELSDEGYDTVYSGFSYTLGLDVDNLTLTGTKNLNGTGNALYNALSGNAGANILNGGAGGGADWMAGGAGDDTYYVDAPDDWVSEQMDEGVDIVYSSAARYTLGGHVENLTLSGSGDIDGVGNGLTNVLTGNAGNNLLDGGFGVDTLAGGAGNDTYIIDLVWSAAGYKLQDTVNEKSDQGTDSIIVRLVWPPYWGLDQAPTLTLQANVEHMSLELAGDNAINLTGNSANNILLGADGANTLMGGAGNDTLDGGLGNDTLVGGLGIDTLFGGAGLDRFVFDTALGAGNVDTLSGFVAVDDTIVLSKSIFTALSGAVLYPSAFVAGLVNETATTRIVYEAGSGALYYDADGSGAGSAVLFAKIVGISGALTASAFQLAA